MNIQDQGCAERVPMLRRGGCVWVEKDFCLCEHSTLTAGHVRLHTQLPLLRKMARLPVRPGQKMLPVSMLKFIYMASVAIRMGTLYRKAEPKTPKTSSSESQSSLCVMTRSPSQKTDVCCLIPHQPPLSRYFRIQKNLVGAFSRGLKQVEVTCACTQSKTGMASGH